MKPDRTATLYVNNNKNYQEEESWYSCKSNNVSKYQEPILLEIRDIRVTINPVHICSLTVDRLPYFSVTYSVSM